MELQDMTFDEVKHIVTLYDKLVGPTQLPLHWKPDQHPEDMQSELEWFYENRMSVMGDGFRIGSKWDATDRLRGGYCEDLERVSFFYSPNFNPESHSDVEAAMVLFEKTAAEYLAERDASRK